MKPVLLLRSLVYFLKTEKKWWTLPLVVGLVLLLVLIALAESAPVLSPFLYTVF